ncbi:TIGR02206 family membrane protein [Aerococcaceae bacterium DSM 111022]|nr:TIGR02206 family membrane protein [Aerococcaceae bacterium DSM 111022]
MERFWSIDVDYIELFSVSHLFYFTVFILCIIGLIRFRESIRRNSNAWRFTILVVSIFQQFLLYGWYADQMGYPLNEALPLHISRVSLILGIVYLITLDKRVMNVMGYFSVFAYLSFLAPAKIHPPFHALGWSYLINHVITILLPYFASIAYDWHPTKESLKRAFIWLIVYTVAMLIINPLVDGNYFYLTDRPLGFLQPIPMVIYVPGVLLAGLLMFWMYYYGFNRLKGYFRGRE